MLTKLETILIYALILLTTENGLFGFYVVEPNGLLLYAAVACEITFFVIIFAAITHFSNIKHKRIIAGD